jgi:hypothetical protein
MSEESTTPDLDELIASVTYYPEADIDEARAAAERLAEERG